MSDQTIWHPVQHRHLELVYFTVEKTDGCKTYMASMFGARAIIAKAHRPGKIAKLFGADMSMRIEKAREKAQKYCDKLNAGEAGVSLKKWRELNDEI